MITAEQNVLKAGRIFQGIQRRVVNARKDSVALHEVEQWFWQRSLEAMRLMLEAYVALKGDGDRGRWIRTCDGTVLPRGEIHRRPYWSVFGKVQIERMCYGRGKIEATPLDAELNLPCHCYSYLLQKWTQDIVVDVPFQKAVSKIVQMLGIREPVRSVEKLNRHLSQSVEAFREQARRPGAESEGEILVASADATSVPLCWDKEGGEEPTRAPAHRRPVGKNAQKRSQAVCSALYSVARFVRGPEDVLEEVLRNERRRQRPALQNKWVRGDLLGGKAAAFSWLARESARRGHKAREPCDVCKSLVVILDGDPALWEHARNYLGVDQKKDVVGVLDIFHVLERLWHVAYLFHAQGSPQAQQFVGRHLRMLLEGRVGTVIGALRQMATKRGWHFEKRKRARRTTGEAPPKRERKTLKTMRLAIEYFQRSRAYMRYDQYLRAGYPIGSGVAEGTCRNLVKDRMDGTGMRWTPQGAQAMLHVRAIHISGQWQELWQYHTQSERQRLYGAHDLANAPARSLAA